MFVFGGFEATGEATDPVAEVLDLDAGTFTALDPALPGFPGQSVPGRGGLDAVLLGDGSVFLAGGRTVPPGTDGGLTTRTEYFLAQVGAFTKGSPLPTPLADQQVDLNDGSVVVMTGGITEDGGTEVPQGSTLTVVPPAGLNFPPMATAGTFSYDSLSETATVGYSLSDADGDLARVRIDYTTTPLDDGSWRPVTRHEIGGLPQGDGFSELEADPGGTAHTFEWDVAADLGSSPNAAVTLRIRPWGALPGPELLVEGTVGSP